MKKSFYTIIAAFVTIVSISSCSNWRCKYYEVDELTGWGGYYENTFNTETGKFFSCDGKKITMLTEYKIYGYYRDRRYDYDLLNDAYITVIVGFYEGKKLKEKVTKEFDIALEGLTYLSLEDEELSKKILNHLKKVGNVRIRLDGRLGCITDITLPMSKKIMI